MIKIGLDWNGIINRIRTRICIIYKYRGFCHRECGPAPAFRRKIKERKDKNKKEILKFPQLRVGGPLPEAKFKLESALSYGKFD